MIPQTGNAQMPQLPFAVGAALLIVNPGMPLGLLVRSYVAKARRAQAI
jgi:hypothetical protein